MTGRMVKNFLFVVYCVPRSICSQNVSSSYTPWSSATGDPLFQWNNRNVTCARIIHTNRLHNGFHSKRTAVWI